MFFFCKAKKSYNLVTPVQKKPFCISDYQFITIFSPLSQSYSKISSSKNIYDHRLKYIKPKSPLK